jgi:hypothetical protein
MTPRRWLPWTAATVLTAGAGLGVEQVRAQRGLGFGPPDREERPLVEQFDADRNGRLSDAERADARTWLAAQPQRGSGPGRRGFGPPPGFNAGSGAPPFMPPPGGRGGRLATPTPGARLSPGDVAPAGSAPLYDRDTLRTIFIEFTGTDWEGELADFYNTDVDVPVTVTVDGQRYPDVGVHFRGLSSFMMVPAGSKRSLNLSFDFANDDQRLLGYRTLNLLNANGDPSFLRPMLYAEIARHYIPTPRTNSVRVVINGEYWGVYINAQQFNADFTRDFFASTKGARWKVPGSPGGRGGLEYLGDSVDAYRRIYEIKTRDSVESWHALIELCRVLNTTPPASLEAALTPMLDVDETLKFLALEVALVNSDGYWARASDYSLYRDERGRFHVLPHDINEALADERGPGPGRRGFGGGGGGGGVTLEPLVGLDDTTKPLRAKLLAVPALRARYLAYVRDIAERWLDWRTLGPVASRYRALIANAVRADTRKLYTFDTFDTAMDDADDGVKTFTVRRRAFLLAEKQR